MVAAINPEVESLFGMCIISALLIELIKSLLRGKKVEKLRLRALACRWSESNGKHKHMKGLENKNIFIYIYICAKTQTAKKLAFL